MYLVHHKLEGGIQPPLNLNIGTNMYFYMEQHGLQINPRQSTFENPEEVLSRKWAEDNEPKPEEPLRF